MASINIRMDDDLKKAMEETCQELGMSLTTAITIFAKKVTREKRIPFEVSIDPFYSVNNMAEIDKRIQSIDDGSAKVVVKTLEELQELEKKDE